MQRNHGIDLVRLIAAFAIILLHSGYGYIPQVYVDNIRLLTRWAVPFFFLASGYLLAPKIDTAFFGIQKSSRKLIFVFIISSIIYTPIQLLKGNSFQIQHLFTGTFFHLWFISALLFGIVFMWGMYQLRLQKLLPYLAVIIIMTLLYTDSYDALFQQSVDYDDFRFLLSIPLLYIGTLIAKRKWHQQISYSTCILFILFGFMLQIIESNFLLYRYHYEAIHHQLLSGTIVASIPIFILSLKWMLKENRLSIWGRKYSLFLYLYHPIAYMGIYTTINLIMPAYFKALQPLYPFIAFFSTLIVAQFLERKVGYFYQLLTGNSKSIDTIHEKY